MAQALAKVGACINSDALTSEVLPCLQKLVKDSDIDVRFYANEAIDTLKCPSNDVAPLVPVADSNMD